MDIQKFGSPIQQGCSVLNDTEVFQNIFHPEHSGWSNMTWEEFLSRNSGVWAKKGFDLST